MTKSFSLKKSISNASTLLFNNLVTFYPAYLTVTVIGLIISIPNQVVNRITDYGDFDQGQLALFSLLSLVFSLLSALISTYLSIGFGKFILGLVDSNKTPEFVTIFSANIKQTSKLLLASMIIGFAAGFGLLFLLVPGIILIILFSQTSAIFADKENVGTIESLKLSIKYTEGVRGKLFLTGIVFFLINLLGALAFLVGLLITIPVTSIAAYSIYRELQLQSEGKPNADAKVEAKEEVIAA
jgi:uncharacterized membrane protein